MAAPSCPRCTLSSPAAASLGAVAGQASLRALSSSGLPAAEEPKCSRSLAEETRTDSIFIHEKKFFSSPGQLRDRNHSLGFGICLASYTTSDSPMYFLIYYPVFWLLQFGSLHVCFTKLKRFTKGQKGNETSSAEFSSHKAGPCPAAGCQLRVAAGLLLARHWGTVGHRGTRWPWEGANAACQNWVGSGPAGQAAGTGCASRGTAGAHRSTAVRRDAARDARAWARCGWAESVMFTMHGSFPGH